LVNNRSKLAQKRSISLEQLKDYPLAGCAFSFDDYLQTTFLQNYHIHPSIAFRSTNFDLVQEYVLHSNAFAFAFIRSTQNLEKTFRNGIAYLPVKDDIVAHFYAIYNATTPNRKQIEAFVQILHNFCKPKETDA